MGNGEGSNNKTTNNKTVEGRNWFDLLIVAVAILALLGALWIVVDRYQTSKDAAAVLGIVAPAIATVAAAVFGVTVGQLPGKAKTRTAKELQPQVEMLSSTIDSVFGEIETSLPSPPGERVYAFRENTEAPRLEFNPEGLASARTQLGRIQEGLDSIAR